MSDNLEELDDELTATQRLEVLERRLARYLSFTRIVATLAGLVVIVSLAAGVASTLVALDLLERSDRLECRERLAGHSDRALADFLDGIAELARDDPSDIDGLATAAGRARRAATARAIARDPCHVAKALEAELKLARTIP